MEQFYRRTMLSQSTRYFGAGRTKQYNMMVSAAKRPSFLLQYRSLSSSSTTTTSPSVSSSGTGTSRVASRRLYRILQRQCAEFARTLPCHESGESMILFQPALNPNQTGSHRVLNIKTIMSEQDDAIRNLLIFFRDWNEDNGERDVFDWYDEVVDPDDVDPYESSSSSSDTALDRDFTDEPTLWATISVIQKTIRHVFRQPLSAGDYENDPKCRQRMNKYAICAVRMLIEQQETWRLSSVSYDQENDIRVVATSKHIGKTYSGPRKSAQMKNRFNYRIRIENLSDQETVQLLGRYWHIQELESTNGEDDNMEEIGEPIIVDAPNSGAGKIHSGFAGVVVKYQLSSYRL